MFSILDDPYTTYAQVEKAVEKGLISPVSAAEWRVTRRQEKHLTLFKRVRRFFGR